MSKTNQRASRNKSASKSSHHFDENFTMANDRNMPDTVFVNSDNIQIALQSFINRHRSSLQKLLDQNHKLSQNNSMLNVQLNNQEGTIMALNEKIAAGAKEIAKFKEEQARLTENKMLLRSELMEYKKRSGELMIHCEKELQELQKKVDKYENELKERDIKEVELEGKLDAIRIELQTKNDECARNNEMISTMETEINASNQQILELQKSLTNLRDELKEKDETIDKVRTEYADYKAETEKTISKMKEVQQIFYPNAANPLPRAHESAEIRSTLPTSAIVQPSRQNRATLKRSSSTSSSDSESDNELLVRERMAQARIFDQLRASIDYPVGFEGRSTDIPATPESSQPPRRKRFRH
ncbi:tropomyosin-1-like isoform X2 [Eurosta solidaginis]|uniref:tropomyosin-1-like isoform X2 n=1 Tax=Eurosta solidaginis TaxID=178769 RepID=UPI0035308A14